MHSKLLYLSYFLLFGTVDTVRGELSDDEIEQLIYEKVRLAGRQEEVQNKESSRKELPDGDFFNAGLTVEELYCGNAYDINKKGYLYFQLLPNKETCQFTFVGSKKGNCTAAMLCRGMIALAPPTSQGCVKESLTLSDGTHGMTTGCGNFSFKGKPRVPRSNGLDLYVTLKGLSAKKCIVFCVEELGKRSPRIGKVQQLKRIKNQTKFKKGTDCQCGIRRDDGRVVGGNTAAQFEFPWLGSLVHSRPGFQRKPFCGGSVINSQYFVSAAHCFTSYIPADNIQILLHHHVMDRRVPKNKDPNDPSLKEIPGWDLPNETDESEHSIRMDVAEIIRHPLFDSESFTHDVAILRFKTPLEFHNGSLVSPICLPDLNDDIQYRDGEEMTVAGWGRHLEEAKAQARIPQKVDVPFVNFEKCKNFTAHANTHLCAGYLQGGKDACQGDSGGPLIARVHKDPTKFFLSGIVSAGKGCARKSELGLYTDVRELLQWIYAQTKDGKWCS